MEPKVGNIVWLTGGEKGVLPVQAKVLNVDEHRKVALCEILPVYRNDDDLDGLCEVGWEDIGLC
jgi:hypothetical protein